MSDMKKSTISSDTWKIYFKNHFWTKLDASYGLEGCWKKSLASFSNCKWRYSGCQCQDNFLLLLFWIPPKPVYSLSSKRLYQEMCQRMFGGEFFFLVSSTEFSALCRQLFTEEWHGDVLSCYVSVPTIKKQLLSLLARSLIWSIRVKATAIVVG